MDRTHLRSVGLVKTRHVTLNDPGQIGPAFSPARVISTMRRPNEAHGARRGERGAEMAEPRPTWWGKCKASRLSMLKTP
jgi:hypothetical protein